MLRVLEGALRHRAASNNPNLVPVIKAFESLERYILLLVDQPWKPEYKKLKVSTNFPKILKIHINVYTLIRVSILISDRD